MKLTRQRYFLIDSCDLDSMDYRSLKFDGLAAPHESTKAEEHQSHGAWTHTPVGWLNELPEYEISGTPQGPFSKATSINPSGFLKCLFKHSCGYRTALHIVLILRTRRFGDKSRHAYENCTNPSNPQNLKRTCWSLKEGWKYRMNSDSSYRKFRVVRCLRK